MALLIAGAVTAIVVLIAVVVAIVADDDDPGVQAGATTQDSTPDRTAVTTSGRSTTTARRSTTTGTRSSTTLRPGASTSSGVPSSGTGQAATTAAGQTTIAPPTSVAPPPSRVPPADDESTTTTSTNTGPNPTVAPGTVDNPVPLGSVAPIGDGWNFSVSGYLPDATQEVLAEDELNEAPPDGFQYALANVAATYNGTEPTASMFDVDVGVVGPSDFETDMFSCPVVVPNELDTSIDVSPGGTVTGNVCFMLPTLDAAAVVVYATGGFTNDDVYFALR